jgi:F0F1-type ATP synthase assembly protein I
MRVCWHTQVATKTDLIAVEEAAVRAMFTNKVDLTKRGDAFSLGERDKVTTTLLSFLVAFFHTHIH